MMPTSDLLDDNAVRQLADDLGDGAAAMLLDLIAALDRDVRRSLDEMYAALAHDNAGPLRQAAHRLRGSFASLGATKAALLCQELETIGAGGDLQHAAPMVKQLDGLCKT